MAVVIDVNRANASQLWPRVLYAVNKAHFIAIDLEMTGIGMRNKKRSKDLAERYPTLREAAQSRALLSLGIACYTSTETAPRTVTWTAQTFDVALFCQRDYVVEPQSLSFLHRHGFDFNHHVEAGLPYTPPSKAQVLGQDDKPQQQHDPAELFRAIIAANVPIVAHNGLIDLLFLYESFWAPLPTTWAFFTNNASQLFANVVDTKYLSEFVAQDEASFLEFVFRKHYRNQNADKCCMPIAMASYTRFLGPASYVTVAYPRLANKANVREKVKVCGSYSRYGFCRNSSCEQSHDLDEILDQLQASKPSKRAKVLEALHDTVEVADMKGSDDSTTKPAVEGHRAGYDAFMTGYIYASLLPTIGEKHKGQLYIMGAKRNGLKLVKSAFSDYTATHQAAWKQLQALKCDRR
eukprot:m.31327 g.31327  ORF g.31327 m.31327 type:complete len:407 (-) comp12059_c0_seq1:35-1255(-)